jgi:hypothetical protein
MENNYYIINQQVDYSQPQYWSNTYKRFVYNKNLATVFGPEILTTLPPTGATGVIEELPDGTPGQFWGVSLVGGLYVEMF